MEPVQSLVSGEGRCYAFDMQKTAVVVGGAEAARAGIAVSLLLPAGVKGELATNSARQREQVLGEPYAPERGQQPQGRQLVDADTVGDDFVRRWLEGQAVISNAPKALMASIRVESDLLLGTLSDR